MKASAAARRYARALFSLAEETNSVATFRDEIDRVGALFESDPAVRSALFRPLHPVAQRRSALEAICEHMGVSDTVRNFLAFLVDQRRLIDFDGIQQEFARLADEAAGLTKAHVTAAAPLDDAQRDRLQRALTARTGRNVELDITVDPELIGGAVAVVDNVVFDGSLRTQLQQLRDNLSRGH